ncbi:MAG: hypothetical protein P8N59_06895 [Planktomarina sp.]|nr:hypothetical protein [Planktomarina sp.]
MAKNRSQDPKQSGAFKDPAHSKNTKQNDKDKTQDKRQNSYKKIPIQKY